MLNKIIKLMAVVALAALLTPSEAGAYGAAHVGYTHVGPNGVYHTGGTAVSTPHGAYAGGHTTAAGAGGGAYHAGSGGAYHTGGAAAGGYHYDYHYSGGAAAGGNHYGYVR